MGRNDDAHQLYASCLSSHNHRHLLAIFQKSEIIVYKIRYYESALIELKRLKEIVPEEPKIYFLMGKIYKAMAIK
ncbi:unnamed protein product [Rhizophagus irregularis]|nr:unnamed protein product [Rhizophagus irregularis]